MKAVVLSGGGSKGAYQIGVWRALRKLNISYDLVTGTSVGALNGALMVQKDYLKGLWLWYNMDFKLIFGEEIKADYNTKDGTCRRDFIHVVDLAKGHLSAVKALEAPGFKAYNLGTGAPTSVLEMVEAFERTSGRPLPHKFVARRPGDLAEIWANPKKAKEELGWQTELTIENAIKDTLTFLEKHH